MRLRFLHTVDSDAVDYPFTVGQVIEVRSVTAQIRGWLERRWAEIVGGETAALAAAPERAALPRPKPRGRR